MRARFAFLVLPYAAYGLVQACGGSTGTGVDASTDVTMGNDAPNNGNDAATNDVSQPMDTGTTDTGSTDASDGGVDSGSTGITTWGCGTATVTSCALCIGHTQECVYCADNDASALAGNCVEQGTGCVGAGPNGYETCTCPGGDAGECPESNQVCLKITNTEYDCLTCGEYNGTNGLTCTGGGKCDAVDAGCL
jgi:hypothetical protein